MSVSSRKASKRLHLPALYAEECIAHQLAEIALRLHELSRLGSYRQVIVARNELLAMLDSELILQAKQNEVARSDFSRVHNHSMIDCTHPKRTALKIANHAR